LLGRGLARRDPEDSRGFPQQVELSSWKASVFLLLRKRRRALGPAPCRTWGAQPTNQPVTSSTTKNKDKIHPNGAQRSADVLKDFPFLLFWRVAQASSSCHPSPTLYQEALRATKIPLEIAEHATPRQWFATSCGRAQTRRSRRPSVVGSRIPRKGASVSVRCQRFSLGRPPARGAVGRCLHWLGGE
jgi:hypothetical protein